MTRRRSVRSAWVRCFAVPYATLAPWPAALARVREAGFSLLALTPAADAVPIRRLAPTHRARPALLLGAERPACNRARPPPARSGVRIRMRHSVDSLNVATAAVACWELIGDGRSPDLGAGTEHRGDRGQGGDIDQRVAVDRQ
jgi:tRNA G18 (ribose-2'-O)-methylase SpoU